MENAELGWLAGEIVTNDLFSSNRCGLACVATLMFDAGVTMTMILM
jgi:hypothetical protein